MKRQSLWLVLLWLVTTAATVIGLAYFILCWYGTEPPYPSPQHLDWAFITWVLVYPLPFGLITVVTVYYAVRYPWRSFGAGLAVAVGLLLLMARSGAPSPEMVLVWSCLWLGAAVGLWPRPRRPSWNGLLLPVAFLLIPFTGRLFGYLFLPHDPVLSRLRPGTTIDFGQSVLQAKPADPRVQPCAAKAEAEAAAVSAGALATVTQSVQDDLRYRWEYRPAMIESCLSWLLIGRTETGLERAVWVRYLPSSAGLRWRVVGTVDLGPGRALSEVARQLDISEAHVQAARLKGPLRPAWRFEVPAPHFRGWDVATGVPFAGDGECDGPGLRPIDRAEWDIHWTPMVAALGAAGYRPLITEPGCKLAAAPGLWLVPAWKLPDYELVELHVAPEMLSVESELPAPGQSGS